MPAQLQLKVVITNNRIGVFVSNPLVRAWRQVGQLGCLDEGDNAKGNYTDVAFFFITKRY